MTGRLCVLIVRLLHYVQRRTTVLAYTRARAYSLYICRSFPQRAIFPEPPAICVTFFSCVGTNVSGTSDLQHTYAAAVHYLEAQQRGSQATLMRYELVWIDNGGSQEDHEHFLLRGAQFEVHHRNPTNEGLFRAVNDAWFRGRGCRAPYVLSLEDDRVARPDLATESSVQHLAYSMTLLRHDETLAGVRLKDEWSDEIIAAAAAAELGHPQPAITLPAVAIGAPRHIRRR